MKKKMIALGVYIVLLILTVSAAWILQTQQNIGNFAELFYGGDSGNRLRVSDKDVTMEVLFLINDKWQYIGSSDNPERTTEIALNPETIVPHASAPFRIRFSNSSEEMRTVNLSMAIKCSKQLMDKQAVFVAASAGQNYTKYAGQVVIPTQVYHAVIADDGNYYMDSFDEFVLYDTTLYETLEIPPTSENGAVELSCYFYFDKDRMDNECAGCHFEIVSFEAG